ncbi:hypothetical protein GCM10009760_27730 [Kitasatospora kazusensis]|uniref:Adenosine deaminase n=1 Tax=Kitasatospora kazusensis TaxID=407974 RepID=A0ABP5L976_9ACTN
MLLHDHLDGGLRPLTVVELARECGYGDLPTTDAEELGTWFQAAADSGSLERYLETFRHTVGVTQTREALFRVAAECAEDLAADGVVYAEVRFAPELHVERGLTLGQVVEAVLDGFREGERRAATAGHGIRVGALLAAMRHADRAQEVAELVVLNRHSGVVGFDIAGAEAGYRPTRQLSSFEYLKRENAHFTIHAGEAFGLPSIWEALQLCGTERLGHGVRIIDDIKVADDGTATLGELAAYVRDRRIPLELCPTSNLQTGAAASYAEHPVGVLRELGFRVTVNTDNRLMSGTSVSREFEELSAAFGYTLDDVQWFTINAMKSSFLPFDERLAVINDVIKPGFAALRAEAAQAVALPEQPAAPGPDDVRGAPDIVGRSKRLWRRDDGTCEIEIIPSLRSFTYDRDELIPATAKLRLDFYQAAAARLAERGIRTVFRERLSDSSYLADFVPGPPFEVIVKNLATGSTTVKYPGLFAEGHRFEPPVVKFDFRVDPEDQPIGEDYLKALGVDTDAYRRTALACNEALRDWLAPLDLWDFCLVIGDGPDGQPVINSEISPDCMRLRDPQGRPLDKDLFRQGASAHEIVAAWTDLVRRISG